MDAGAYAKMAADLSDAMRRIETTEKENRVLLEISRAAVDGIERLMGKVDSGELVDGNENRVQCPCCLTHMPRMVVAGCGHVFCKECWDSLEVKDRRLRRVRKECPLCRKRCEAFKLYI